MTNLDTNQFDLIFEFDQFRLDVSERLLLREGKPVPMTPKVFDTLLLLVENAGRLVGKNDLMSQIWPDSFVEEGALTRNISDLRKALGENATGRKFIETVPKHGYRFVAEVWVRSENDFPVSAESDFSLQEISSTEPSTAPYDKPAENESSRPRLKTRLIVATLLAGWLAVIGYFAFSWGKGNAPEDVTQIKSLAVLPFKSLTQQAGNEYLELGVTDTLITRLGGFEQLLVRPMNTVRRYADSNTDSLHVGQELQVDAVLEGSFQKLDEKVRVTVRLLRVADGRQLWAYQCEEYCASLFAVQDAISERVAAALALQLTGEERQRLTKHYTENTEAYQLYLRGRWFWNQRTEEGFQKAIIQYEQSLKLDPQYPLAWTGLADCWHSLAGFGFVSPKEAIPKAKAAVEKAIALDPSLAEAHATAAIIAQNHDRDWSKAEKSYLRAIEINPNYATALAWYGEMIAWLGRPEEGFRRMQQALKLDPTSLTFNKDLAVMLYLARKNDQALDQLKKTLELDPNFQETHFWLTLIYAQQGRYEEAVAESYQLRTQWQKLFGLGYVYARMGKTAEARQMLKEMQALSLSKYVQPIRFALVHAALGEKDQAFAWLEKEYETGGAGLTGLRSEPMWDLLRDDPRFADLRRRTRLD